MNDRKLICWTLIVYKILYKIWKLFATEALLNSGMYGYFIFISFYFSDCIIELQNCHRCLSKFLPVLCSISVSTNVSVPQRAVTALLFFQ